jgi:Fe-Mn family superoxide dismutase
MNSLTSHKEKVFMGRAVSLLALVFMLGSAGLLWASEDTMFDTGSKMAAGSKTIKEGSHKMPFVLPPLPYDNKALEPFISAETLEFHYGKHHATYVTNLNNLIAGKPETDKSLEEIIMAAEGPLFNNAAQVWNHTFLWNSMKPNGGGEPKGELAAAIVRDFGSYDGFVKEFTAAATTQFGSGWAWLVLEDGKLKVVKTANADLPMKHGQKALLTLDVWEHAYYIDYRNARVKYIETFLTKLIDWDFADINFK